MTTWYAQADADWTSAQWNDQADGQGNAGAPGEGDTADANAHAISIGAESLPLSMTLAGGSFTFSGNYTFGQGMSQGVLAIDASAAVALGAYAYTLEPGLILNVLGSLTLAAGGTLNASGVLLGNVTSDGTINLGAGLSACPAGTLQIGGSEVVLAAGIDWPAADDVLKEVAFDNGARVGTYDAAAEIAAAVAAQLTADQAAVLASAAFILFGHSILEQAGTYQPETAGEATVTIPEDLRELYADARAQLLVEAQRTPKNWPKISGYASVLRATIADGQVEQEP